MTLLLFIRPFPARDSCVPWQEFPKGGFWTGPEVGKKADIRKRKNKSREKRSGRRGSENAY
jgi:hypothetical protein